MVVGRDFELERQPRRERGVGQRALAEAVDREDRRFVEGLQCEVELAAQTGFVGNATGAHRGEQLRHEGVAGGAAAVEMRKRFDDAEADPLAQFRGGRLGEGDHQNPLDRQPVFKQQPQVEAADVPGLAGAGRGFDQADAGQRAGEDIEITKRTHAVRSASVISSPNTSCATCSNSASSGSATPRNASW